MEFWTPEPLHAGRTVVCLASGPSLTLDIVRRCTGQAVITVNSSAYACVEAGITDATLYFTDSGWYTHRRDLVANWPGLVVSMSRTAKREMPDKVKRVKGVGSPPFPPRQNGRPGFPALGSSEIQQGRNSGNTAVSLAIAMGACRVLLVGYDCKVVNGREHFHPNEGDYAGPRDLGLYDDEYKRAFAGWREAAEASGVDILNATPGSAITEFEMVDLNEALACTAR